MSETTNQPEAETKAEEVKKPGKFYIEITTRIYFDSAEEREHHLKDHVDVPFDDKTTLLNGGEVEIYDEDEEISINVNLKEVRE